MASPHQVVGLAQFPSQGLSSGIRLACERSLRQNDPAGSRYTSGLLASAT